MKTFTENVDFHPAMRRYPVWRLLFSAHTFIQSEDFYPVWGLLSKVDTFTQSGEFYSVGIYLSSVESSIQLREFLSSVETFVHCGNFCPV